MPNIQCKGVIFDLDGVITNTARVHALAWEKAFNVFLKKMAEREGKTYTPFDRDDDYVKYVDGKPRYQGVKSFLQSRGYDLPYGDPSDSSDQETICGVGNNKNELFQEVLKIQGPEVYQTSMLLVEELVANGIQVAVASSSRNCRTVLEYAGVIDHFPVIVDGVVSAELHLKGKPDPDIFTTAATRLGLAPGECVVVEDAISGVQAGKTGNFGLVLGVSRGHEGHLLHQFGADIVVCDLGEISLQKIQDWFLRGIEEDNWKLTYKGFDQGEEKLRETLCTIGNGYLGTRGCFESERASFSYYPGTYLAGIFNKLPTKIHDRDIYNNDFVNCPNWLLIEFRIGCGEFMSPMQMEVLSFQQTLHMREAYMEWSIVFRDSLGRITRINPRRIASMANPHICAIRYDVTPLNYSDTITIRSSLDGNVKNDGVARYRELRSDHLEGVDAGQSAEGIYLQMRTKTSKYEIAMASKTLMREGGKCLPVETKILRTGWQISEEVEFEAGENTTYSIEKLVTIYTSRDKDIAHPRQAALEELAPIKSFKGVFSPHVRAWETLWDKADICIIGDRFVQKVLRLHIYHLLVTASPNNLELDAGMPARGLHGEAYRGHIFWDELYIFPFFDSHFPEITRSLLQYRYNRLDGARQYAKENGYKGAMYPWQTADGGEEETQELHFNPENNSWGPDLSRRQRHVSIAVFYNTWRHVKAANDSAFLKQYGAEMMLEIARFWASITNYDQATGRYHISGVMGPDEFHEKLPESETPGLKDNAYTNILVVWLLEKAIELVAKLPEATLDAIARKTGFKRDETAKWQQIIRKMAVEITSEGILSQFSGYMELKELDWDYYRKRYYSIHRMDRILKAEGDSPDKYKVAKQADTLMMFYVLSPKEIKRILLQLGYEVGDALEMLKANYDYYVRRTSHGSTLSKVVHAIISGYADAGDTVWNWFMEAMRSDIFDTQGGTTTEGIHTGVMAGTLDVIYRYFAGISLLGNTPEIHPQLPSHWKSLQFSFCHERVWYDLHINHKRLIITSRKRGGKQVFVKVQGQETGLLPGKEKVIRLQ